MSCSRTQHGGGRSRTPDLSLRSPTLYHWATALPLQLQRPARGLKFGFRKLRYYSIQAANNKGADQTAWMGGLICAFVVHIWHKQVFSWRGSLNVCYFVGTLKIYHKIHKIWTPEIFLTMPFYHRVIWPKDVNGMADSVDADQTAPSDLGLHCLPDLSVQILWII